MDSGGKGVVTVTMDKPTPEPTGRPAEFVEALAKGLAIMETFDSAHSDMTLSEIARRVEITPAAARRSLITLMELGYIGQTGKRFYLRPKILGLGAAFFNSAQINELLQPEVRNIVELFGDASSVGVLDGADVIYVAHYSVQRARRATAVVGARYPAHATSLGQVLLAGLPDEAFDRYLARMVPVPFTNRTLVDKDALRQRISDVRRQGYSTTVDELDYGITALAVPIRNREGRHVAAVNSSGYSGLVSAEQLVRDRLGQLSAASTRLSAQFDRYPMLEALLGQG